MMRKKEDQVMTLQLQNPPHVDEPLEAQQYADILGRVAADRQAVIVRRGGADLAAVVPLEFLELLQEMVARRTCRGTGPQARLAKIAQGIPSEPGMVRP